MHINTRKFISPNFSQREYEVDTIIIHSTHMSSISALKRLCDKESSVSSHYLIDLEGVVYQLVSDDNIAWHAGVSYWAGRTHLNKYSLGIELVDRFDDGKEILEFPSKQIESLIELLKSLISIHKIKNHMILAHSDIAPDRKDDPGEKFPWKTLAENNIGIFHSDIIETLEEFCIKYGDTCERVLLVQKMLKEYGYKISCNSVFDKEMNDVVKAFKMHFDQRNINETFDQISLAILKSISAQKY